MKNPSELSKEELIERLDLVYKITDTGYWTYLTETDTLLWDEGMFQLYGVDRKDFTHSFADWQKACHNDDVKETAAQFNYCIKNDIDFKGHFRIYHPAGIRHIRASGSPLKDGSGKIIGIAGVNMDYTLELQSKYEAERAASLYRTFINQNPTATAMVDNDVKYIAASNQWIKDYGLEGVDIIGRSHYEVFPEIGDEWKEIHARCLNGQGDQRDLDRFEREDGSALYLRWSVQPWYHNNGAIGGMIMFSEDITERVLSEKENEVMHTLFQETKDIARIGIWDIDLETGETYVDDVVREIYGVDKDYHFVAEEGIKFYKEGESRQRIEAAFDELVETGKSYDLELQLVNTSGEDVWVRSIGSPVYDSNTGKIVKVSGMFQDIDKEKRALDHAEERGEQLQRLSDRLAQRNRSLSEFAHIASHNLRSPVSNLISLSELYNEFPEDEKPMVFEKIHSEIQRLSSTLDDLVNSLVIRDSGMPAVSQISLEKLTNSIVQSLSMIIEKADFQVNHDFSAVPIIESSERYLHSIFLNLITNAIKYRRSGVRSKLDITSQCDDTNVKLIFEDNGIGIDLKGKEDRIFGLYNTFHQNTDSKGVGLFMVKAHVEGMGGSISVQSKVNKGTTFTILIPSQK